MGKYNINELTHIFKYILALSMTSQHPQDYKLFNMDLVLISVNIYVSVFVNI